MSRGSKAHLEGGRVHVAAMTLPWNGWKSRDELCLCVRVNVGGTTCASIPRAWQHSSPGVSFLKSFQKAECKDRAGVASKRKAVPKVVLVSKRR
jgi:hypothetical protein